MAHPAERIRLAFGGLARFYGKLAGKTPDGDRDGARGLLEPVVRKYNSLPQRERKTLAFGGAAAGLIIFYFALAEPVWNGYTETKNDIPRVAKLVKSYKTVIVGSEERRKQYAAFESDFGNLLKTCLAGETDALTAESLAEAARAGAAKVGLTLKTSRVEKTEEINGFQVVNVSVNFDSSLAKLAEFMGELERSEKLIRIREARISSRKEEYQNIEEEILSVTFLLSGLRHVPSAPPEAAR